MARISCAELPTVDYKSAPALGSVSTDIVEEVIKNGNRTTRLVDGIVRTEHVLGDVHVITEEDGKVVVTVITK